MMLNDVWLLIKKIVAGILIFVIPLAVIALMLWFIQKQ
jgi:hypothetical protein